MALLQEYGSYNVDLCRRNRSYGVLKLAVFRFPEPELFNTYIYGA